MENKQLIELKDMIEMVAYASTKNDAKTLVRKLEFKASSLRNEIEPYSYGKLKETINYAKSASGQVKDKEHWVSCMESAWYVFEAEVRA